MKKRRTRSSLEKELDRVFSIWIRTRTAIDGYNECISCGKTYHWTEMDCGHYISRVHRSTRWDELNCYPQCKRCNIFLKGNYPNYSLALVKRYGSDILEELSIKRNKTVKISTPEMESLIDHYRSLIHPIK
jgi:hypothetical protein